MKIENRSTMSNTTFHKRCTRGQKYWWLRSADGNFVDLGGQFRGDRDLPEIEVILGPGKYTLGCGPRSHGVRETIVVE